jgi:hypothetical protein
MYPVVTPRPLTESEAAVIAAAITRAPVGEPGASGCYLTENLRVVGRCECGCDSVFFTTEDWAKDQYRAADGLGYTEDGEEVGVLVWAGSGGLVHLELYNYSERPAHLPVPVSVCPFEEAKRVRE